MNLHIIGSKDVVMRLLVRSRMSSCTQIAASAEEDVLRLKRGEFRCKEIAEVLAEAVCCFELLI